MVKQVAFTKIYGNSQDLWLEMGHPLASGLNYPTYRDRHGIRHGIIQAVFKALCGPVLGQWRVRSKVGWLSSLFDIIYPLVN